MSETTGEQIVRKLRSGSLPQMVDWIDPGLLLQIGVRDIISGTIGQYADQRLMQAASDQAISEEEIAGRYDYSNFDALDPDRRLDPDASGAVWVDYISDLGDGFEATYAMAYLMAGDRLRVAGPGGAKDDTYDLEAGRLLIMGGDQAYPQATPQEYQNRLIDPYTWASKRGVADRKLFAIPGNHDWYDGLAAFTSLLTAARSRISGGIGREIGAWRSMQHRSYFAIKLPYNWWIWGPDIQLEGTLDDPQRDYFDLMSEQTGEGDKIVLCLAEPSWHHEQYDNLHAINLIARKRGAKICAILAGDWHHYSRYHSSELGIQFITSGGGGAFAHASHQLKRSIELDWAMGVEDIGAEEQPADIDETEPPSAARTPPENRTPPEKSRDAMAAMAPALRAAPLSAAVADAAIDAAGDARARRYDKFKAKFRRKHRIDDTSLKLKLRKTECHADTIYPSRMKSRMLCLKNLALPFRNRRFALLVGMIYLLYSWVFQTAAPELDKSLFQMPATAGLEPSAAASEMGKAISNAFWATISAERVVGAVKGSPMFFFMLIGLWAGLVYYVDLGKGFLNSLGKLVIGTLHFQAHLSSLLIINLLAFGPAAILAAVLTASVSALGLPFQVSPLWIDISSLIFYSVISILVGGFFGALIMGIYWTVTSFAFNMHCGDAFGALSIKDYKHFLRMKFDGDRLTIYPIAIDHVPGRKGWRATTKKERRNHPGQIAPLSDLAPHLIEAPIVIDARDVSTKMQRVD